MKLVVCGQKSFGAAVVAKLDDLGHHVAVSSPASHGSGLPDRTAAEADKRGLPWSPSGLLRAESVRRSGAELIVCAHSHDYIGRKTRNATAHGAIGYHPSLLPRHRGRDAVKWTIKMGDPIAGGTVYVLTDNVDAGPIVLQQFIHVHPEWTAKELWAQLFEIGVHLVANSVQRIENTGGDLPLIAQGEACATWEPSLDSPPMWRPELLELTS